MGQEDGSNHSRKGKHLKWEERIQIETLQREGLSCGDIGRWLGRPERTICHEIRRGWVAPPAWAIPRGGALQRGPWPAGL